MHEFKSMAHFLAPQISLLHVCVGYRFDKGWLWVSSPAAPGVACNYISFWLFLLACLIIIIPLIAIFELFGVVTNRARSDQWRLQVVDNPCRAYALLRWNRHTHHCHSRLSREIPGLLSYLLHYSPKPALCRLPMQTNSTLIIWSPSVP